MGIHLVEIGEDENILGNTFARHHMLTVTTAIVIISNDCFL